jgi:dUTP pyrophosphatase
LVIKANDWKLVKTGISIALPANMVALVHPRSGLALRHGITVLNAPGTIDSGYRGEIGVILYNAGDISFPIFRGDRIAQMVFQQFDTPTFIRVDSLNDSERGDGGFGSSGLN